MFCFSSEFELLKFYCNKKREVRTLWISISNYFFFVVVHAIPEGYSGFQVTKMMEGIFLVETLSIFLDGLI